MSTVTKNHIAMTWCHYIFQSGQAFEQWISSQPIYSLGHLPATVSAFHHHPAYQAVYLFIEKIEVWAVNCISGPLAMRASPHSGIHPERLPWEGGGVLLCCPQHLFPFHSSLVSLFQQSIILQQLAVNSGLERVPTEVSRSPVVKSNRYFIFPCAQPTS